MPRAEKKKQATGSVGGGGEAAAAAARPTLDDKARSALKEALTTASDALLSDEKGRDEATPVDRAVAFIEMGAYVMARVCLEKALETLGKPKMRNRFPKAVATIEETLGELPVEDAEMAVVKGPDDVEEETVAKFDQEPNSTECTVTIPVPAATTRDDVDVIIKRDFISVKVKGHAKQPFVVYGSLRGNVEVGACAWTLDGTSDADRAVVVNLEKESSHPCWKKLLGDPVDYFKDDAGLEGGLQHLNFREDDGTPTPVWTTPAEAAKAFDAAAASSSKPRQ